MSFEPILNPELPYVGEVEKACLTPGKMVKIQGHVPSDATRFAINYQLGPILNPRDDIAIHLSPRFNEGFITRNHIESMSWGHEENEGPMWIQRGAPFEIIILCEYYCYKIAINGRHFAEFAHRLPYDKVTHLVIDGEVEISSIFYETIPIGPKPSAPTVSDMPSVKAGPPAPGGLYPTLLPQKPPQDTDGHNSSQVYGQQKSEEEDAFGNCLDKVGLAVGGLVAAGGVAAAMHAYNKNKKKQHLEDQHEKSEAKDSESGLNLGALGAALASGLASNAFQGSANAHAQQGYPPSDNILGSILGSLGGGGATVQPHSQQSSSDLFGGTLGSILGGVLGGGGHQQPHYQSSGGYSNPQSQGSQGGDLLGGLGGALFNVLSKHGHKSHQNNQDDSSHYTPSGGYEGRYEDNAPPSYASPPKPAPSNSGRLDGLSAAEISKGLGLGNDDD